MMYDYQFTTAAEKAKTGNWWKRTPLNAYFCPVITLESFGGKRDGKASPG
jgi:hypothetical protein